MEISTRAILLLLFTTLAAGCTSIVNPLRVEDVLAEPQPAAEKYTVLPGDELEISFFHTPEYNKTLPVRPDGYLAMPHVGEVSAVGKTPEQISQELVAGYSDVLVNPQIAVIVRVSTAQRIHVGGRVEKPGVFPLTRSMTVLDGIIEAGGYVAGKSQLSQVLVIRKGPGRDPRIIELDLKKYLDGSDLRQNIELRPFDAVVVPDSPIANVNTWVDLYIRQNIPIQVGLRPDLVF